MVVGKGLKGAEKLRVNFFAIMYIVLIALWVDGLVDIDKANEIIASQEAFIVEHQVLTTKYESLVVVADSLNTELDQNKLLHMAKDKYVYGLGHNIDWVKAINEMDYIADLTDKKLN